MEVGECQTVGGALLDGLKIAVPVMGALLVWFVQSLAQRAWSEYEKRRDIYEMIVGEIDAIFDYTDSSRVTEYLRVIRKAWLIGSDDVVNAANALSASIMTEVSDEDRRRLYGEFINAMRKDLRKRRFLPDRSSTLSEDSFPVQGPGRRP